MAKKHDTEKKKNPLGIAIGLGILVLSAMGDTAGELLAFLLVLLLFVGIPVAIGIGISRAAKRRNAAVHTHDRIDHSKDLTIHPKTGKTIRPTVSRVSHTPQEHWKQQLDGLLENGTIDKQEYRALMNRRF